MLDEKEERIRAEAYRRWEQEGRPDGHHDRHWREAAESMTAGGKANGSDGAAQPLKTAKPRAAAKPKAEKAPKAVVKPIKASAEKAPKVAAAKVNAPAAVVAETPKRGPKAPKTKTT